MTGRFGFAMRRARSVSMPLMPGNMMSRMTRSMASSSSRMASACSPVAAMTTSKPSRRRTASRTSRRTSSSSTIRIRMDPGSSVPRHRNGARQRYRELRAPPDDALRGDLAVGAVKNPPRDGEAESCAAAPTLGRDQRLEDPAEEVRRDAFAVVFHLDFHPLSNLFGGDPDVPALAHCVASVEEDVGQNLLQVVKVPADMGFRYPVHMNRDLFWLQKIFVESDRRGDQTQDADSLARARPVGDQIEQVIHQVRCAKGRL